jgi:hypothetical protein
MHAMILMLCTRCWAFWLWWWRIWRFGAANMYNYKIGKDDYKKPEIDFSYFWLVRTVSNIDTTLWTVSTTFSIKLRGKTSL